MQINIPDTAANQIQELAKQAGFESVEQYVLAVVLPVRTHNAVELSPGSPKSFYDAAVETGFIGNGSDYPTDLSSNPEHMKGFGE